MSQAAHNLFLYGATGYVMGIFMGMLFAPMEQ